MMADRLSDEDVRRLAEEINDEDTDRIADECLARGEEIATARGMLEEAMGAMSYRRDIADRIAAFLAGKERPA